MHNSGLAAINAILLILAGGYAVFILRYQFQTYREKVEDTLALYKWSTACGAIAIFIQSILFFLFDLDIITFVESRMIGAIPKILFAIQLAIAYRAIKWPYSDTYLPVAIVVGTSLYVLLVLTAR